MSRRNRHIRSVLATLVVALAPWLAEAELRCDAIPDRERVYLRHHVRHNELTPELEQRTIETYLRRADPSRTLLITSELEAQRAALAGVFERVKAGDCSSLTDVQKALLRRQEAAAKFVRATVTQDDYAIDESISLVLDPEDRGHPETPRRATPCSSS